MKRMLYGLLAAALLLAGCAQQPADEPPALLEPVGVKTDTAVVTRGDLYTVSVYDGSIIAAAEELRFDIDGKISRVSVWPGKWVEAGELLFELDQTQVEKRMEALRRQIDYATTDGAYNDAAADIDIELLERRLEKLRSSGEADEQTVALARLDVEQAKLDLKQAQEMRSLSISALQEELNLLEAEYGRNTIVAPFSGNVFYLDSLVEGTSVQAEKTVAYIANPNDLTMVISTYMAENRLQTSNYYALIGDKRYEVAYEPMSREEMTSILLSGESLPTRFRVVGPEEDLDGVKAGMYAALCVESGRVEDALYVPMGALYSSAGERYVYVQTEDGRERRTVSVGLSNGIDMQITDGLAEGEIVFVKE